MAIGYISQVYTTTGTKTSYLLDPSIVPFNATVAVTITGTVSYKLQWSIDPPDTTDANAHWFDSSDIPAGTAANATSFLAFPTARVRLVIATATGATLTLQVYQGMSTN